MSVKDNKIMRSIWDGKIPVCFVAAEEDVSSLDAVLPIYHLVPRVTYFPTVTDKIQKQFQKFTTQSEETNIWLEYEGQALKWHWPVGILFDLYGNRASLPWKITMHFQNFPKDELLNWPSKEAMESHFMSMVKEADCLKHRSLVINNMHRRDHKQLWSGVQNDRFEQYWAVNRKLMEPATAHSGLSGSAAEESHQSPETAGFRNIPVRLYPPEGGFKQKLVKPYAEDGSPVTFAEVVAILDPELATKTEQYTFVMHGIAIPPETPSQWLAEFMCYPDNFLHICAVSNESISTAKDYPE